MIRLFPFLLLFVSVLLQAQQQPFPHNPALLTDYWQARWIACPDASAHEFGVYHFRKNINLPEKPAKFVIHLSGDHRYRFFVNGQSVCTGPARSDPQHWNFESIDIAPWLQKGANTLAAVVWNGGSNAPFAQMSYRTAFVVQGDTPKEQAVNTDNSWKCWVNTAYTPEPLDMAKMRSYMVVGDGERVDGRQYPWGWEQPGYNDEAWMPAKILWFNTKARGLGTDGNWMLTPRTIPAMEETPQRLASVRRSENCAPQSGFLAGKNPLTIPAHTHATLLLDQGKLTNAYPQLIVSGGSGAKITQTYAEALIDSNRQKGNRNEVDGKEILGLQDVFIADGGQKRPFAPLWFRTYRFLQIDVETGSFPLTITDFYGIFTGYPFVEKATFSSSDATLKGLWETGWHTARLCAGETYYDCPYYEQLQYTGDTRVQSFISLYVSGDDRLMRKALMDYDHSRIPDGLTQSRYPCNDMQVIPTFSLFWVSMVHDYWMQRRDEAFVRSFFKGIDDVLTWHENRLAPNGLNGPMEWWHFTDWCWPWNETERVGGVPPGTNQGGSAILSLQFAYTLRQASELFAALGDKAKAAKYTQLSRRIVTSTQKQCWDNQRQLMADMPSKRSYSQHANIWAVLTDAIPTAEQPALIRRIIADTTLTQATFYFKFYLFEALKKTKTGDAFLPLLKPWHTMKAVGLTTFAENPEPTRSDCHAWSASPNYEFLSLVCGIQPAAPGFRQVRIEPFLGDLQWADGQMPHPDGAIAVHLARKGRTGLEADIDLPAGVTGVLVWNGQQKALKGGKERIVFP
jgi:hypothetical protein